MSDRRTATPWGPISTAYPPAHLDISTRSSNTRSAHTHAERRLHAHYPAKLGLPLEVGLPGLFLE